mgnify:CR=1 FL=1|jgi:Predicted hydrolase of the metallo-beta-lactamase superfamily
MYGVNPRDYDPNSGFVLHYEFMNGIPRKYGYCRSIYGVYARGEMLASPKLVETHRCEMDTVYSNKCIFDETYNIYDVPPVMDALLIFEFQVHFDIGIEKAQKVETLGWSMIDLFDMQRKLKYYNKKSLFTLTGEEDGRFPYTISPWIPMSPLTRSRD